MHGSEWNEQRSGKRYVKGPKRHKETWWWNEEVSHAVSGQKLLFTKWFNNRIHKSLKKCNERRQYANKVASEVKECKRMGLDHTHLTIVHHTFLTKHLSNCFNLILFHTFSLILFFSHINLAVTIVNRDWSVGVCWTQYPVFIDTGHQVTFSPF